MATPAWHLLEASWEVCNKVGGIYTVVSSKAPLSQAEFPGSYYAVGPYLGQGPQQEFRPSQPPAELAGLAERLARRGVSLHYGNWLIEGEPLVLLLGWEGLLGQLNAYKATFWERYQLDTLGSDFYDLDQPLIWSVAVGILAEEYARQQNSPVLVHGHEWLTAGLFLYLDGLEKPPAAPLRTVFTTHATVLGRALSSQNVFIYDKLASLNPEAEARSHGVLAKHQLERLAANLATVFTTVSQVTSDEAAAFLGRRPETILQNGLHTQDFPAFDALCLLHRANRERLHDFVSAYFFPSYRFDLAQTTYQFSMGRYELHNKGYDLYLQALGQLNEQLKQEGAASTLISFLLVPGDCVGLRPETARQLAVYNRISQLLTQLASGRPRELYRQLWEQERPQHTVPDHLWLEVQHLQARLPRPERPAVSPYQLRQGENDAVIRLAGQYGLRNRAEDRVKLLFFPVYFDGLEGVFNLPLYEMISGFDLGVFPSLYEPWGYTPMESLAMGVPAVTSNLSGFGQALTGLSHPEPEGVFFLDRSQSASLDPLSSLTASLRASLVEGDRRWLLRRIAAYQTIQQFSWAELYKNYRQAYNQART